MESSDYTADTQHVEVYQNETRLRDEYCVPVRRHSYGRNMVHVRDKITDFSVASRRRLYQLFRRVNTQQLVGPYFLTLTYHQSYPEHPYEHLKSLLQHAQKLEPEICYIWRLEWQARGAPHFHVLLWSSSYESLLRKPKAKYALALRWSRIIGEPYNRDHLRYGLDLQPIKSYAKAIRYLSKYLAKNEPKGRPTEHQRRWGYSRNLPTNRLWRYEIPRNVHIALRRIARTMLRKKGMTKRKARALSMLPTCTLWVPSLTIVILLEYLRPPNAAWSIQPSEPDTLFLDPPQAPPSTPQGDLP